MKQDNWMVGGGRKFDFTQEVEDWTRELMDHAVGKLCVLRKVGDSLATILLSAGPDWQCEGATAIIQEGRSVEKVPHLRKARRDSTLGLPLSRDISFRKNWSTSCSRNVDE